jgi:hypothetical protein
MMHGTMSLKYVQSLAELRSCVLLGVRVTKLKKMRLHIEVMPLLKVMLIFFLYSGMKAR